MADQVRHSTLAQLHPLDLCQLVFRLLGGNAVDGEAALGIVDETEVLACLLDGNYVHEASRICSICADLAVNFYEALHDDGFGFAGVESIFQSGKGQGELLDVDRSSSDPPITDEDNEWHTITELVRTWGWTRRIGTGQFVQKPV